MFLRKNLTFGVPNLMVELLKMIFYYNLIHNQTILDYLHASKWIPKESWIFISRNNHEWYLPGRNRLNIREKRKKETTYNHKHKLLIPMATLFKKGRASPLWGPFLGPLVIPPLPSEWYHLHKYHLSNPIWLGLMFRSMDLEENPQTPSPIMPTLLWLDWLSLTRCPFLRTNYK